ncbi:hypothetical protein NP493_1128g00007 [Ridgeia piscesae]|uniref:Uncharacterized protein n=1 Tax=Ridgeia piscesae TaxID=27915 RepID=A0AAD9KGH4_RIDPI|nr:hypothetical protein NP493_1128g00007 [Ridgeia piscesae]
MGVVVFVLLTCVTLTTLAVGDGSQLEKTGDETSLDLNEVSQDTSEPIREASP